MASNRSNASRNTLAPEQVLLRGGIARCGYCGRKLSHRPHHSGRAYFCVNRKSRAELARHECAGGSFGLDVATLDREVWAWVAQKLRDPDLVDELRALWEDEKGEDRSEAEKEIASQAGALAKLKERRTNIAAGMGDASDPDTRAVILAQLDNLNPQIRACEAEIARLQGALATVNVEAAQLDALQPWLDVLAAQSQGADYEGRRRILRALGVRIRCYRADHVNPATGQPERWHPYWFEDIDALAAIDSTTATRRLTYRTPSRRGCAIPAR